MKSSSFYYATIFWDNNKNIYEISIPVFTVEARKMHQNFTWLVGSDK